MLEDIVPSIFKSAEYYERIRKHAELKEAELQRVKNELALLKKTLFGRKSEKLQINHADQLLLKSQGQEEIDLSSSGDKVTIQKIAEHTRTTKVKKIHPGREDLPDHLPREVIEIIPDEVKGHEDEYVKIGEDSTEKLEIIEAKLFVRKIIRHKYKHIKKENIIQAPAPKDLFSRFKCGYSLVIFILISKYLDHLPLYRINKILWRDFVKIPESTMISWISQACKHLEPLYNCMLSLIPTAEYIMADETTMPVLERSKQKAHIGYMYAYVVDKSHIIYNYQEGRSAKGPVSILKGFKGTLMTDGYTGYNDAKKENELTSAFCNAHARRRFIEALTLKENDAEIVLHLYSELYTVERKIKNLKSKEKLETREKESAEIFLKIEKFCIENRHKYLPSSAMTDGINYFLNHKEGLELFLKNGEVDIDNLTERTIRPVTIGRKNYMFAGSHEGARRSAIIYSLLMTCRHHGIDPVKYLHKVFSDISNNPDVEYRELLPDRIKLD